MKKKYIATFIIITIITIIFSLLNNNILLNKPNKINIETNYNDNYINHNNVLNNLKNLSSYPCPFGSTNNELKKQSIINYLDTNNINYSIQEDKLTKEYIKRTVYENTKEYMKKSLTKDFKSINVHTLEEYLKYYNYESFDDYLKDLFSTIENKTYNSFNDYINELVEKNKEIIDNNINNIIIPLGNIEDNKESIVFSIHYDTKDKTLGASDNGMNLASILEIARIYKNKTFNNNVYIVLTNAEEIGLYGAKKLVDNNIISKIKLVINFDNLGAGGKLTLYRHNNDLVFKKYLENISNNHSSTYYFELYNFLIDGYETDYDIYQKYYNSLDFTLFMNNKNYHTLNDNFNNINTSSQKEITNTMEELILYFGNDLDNYENNTQIYNLELFNKVNITMPTNIYIIITIILLTIGFIYIAYLIINKNIFKSIINTLLLLISIITFIYIKSFTIIIISLVTLNILNELIKKPLLKNLYYIITYTLILLIYLNITIKLTSLSILGLLILIIPILYLLSNICYDLYGDKIDKLFRRKTHRRNSKMLKNMAK